jgi:ligand-binding sensor domain-containing protein/AraC-like DNA-binding protein/DNA-binding response OmpR family regulator
MKRILTLALLAIACHLFTVDANAQFIFKTLSARDGLTSSQINCILKDDRGFVWFGTPAGLYRYDGYLFKHYQTDSQDASSLPDSYIESIQPALGGELWIKTASGYCIYHSQSESFDRDLRQIFARLGINDLPEVIYIDKKKNLWGYMPSRGVICYNMQQQLSYEFGYTNSAYSIPQGNVVSIGECAEGALIVYDDGRIVCCDATRQQTTPWRNSDIAQRHLRHSATLRVFADQLGNVWLYGQGTLFVLNRQTNTWDTTIGDQLGLTGTNVDNSINGMEADRNGNIWMATSRDGLIRIDLNTRAMEKVTLTTMGAFQRTADAHTIQSVYVDNSDLLWVGTAKAGVAFTGSNIYKFQSELAGDVTAIVQDSTGHLWYGTSDNGVIGLEQRLASMKVTAMAYTNDGSLWVGSKQNGLTRIKNGLSRIYSTSADSIRSTITNDHINDMCVDNVGNLWIATDGGLHIYNLRQEQFSVYSKENRKLQTNYITSLHYATGNRMLIGTPEGLIVLNISTMSTKHYSGNSTHLEKFTNNYITQVFEDSRGLIWLGTRDGVNIFDITSDKIINITEKQGLCNNNICGIAEDRNKNIWITTTNGVTRVVLQRNHEAGLYDYSLYNYTSSDGLQSDEFNLGSIMRTKDGDVVMGGIYGVSSVRKHSDAEGSAIPPVILTQLFVGEEEILTGLSYDGNVILRQALNESNGIHLKSGQNSITVKFAAGNYNQSERLQFMYMMEGLDNDWKNGDPQKHGVTFNDLPSGTFRLHVKAISADGIISQKERVLEIVVEKPWYLQWWMLVFYAIVVITIIYLWKRGIDQLRDLWRRKNAVIAELTQQRDEIKAASDELRQPMSRMTSIMMNLAEREGTTEERDQLNALHTQMLTIITRVSDMQSALEHPEEKAKKNVKRAYELNSQGVMELPEIIDDELTSEIRQHSNSPTAKFRVVFIDDNTDFLKFVAARLRTVYEFHSYNDIHAAAHDIETIVPDLVVCKHDMDGMTGSELCNNIKMHPKLNRIKFVILTETKLTAKEMVNEGITLSADDYMSKPFNVREAAMRFNKLLGISAFDITSNLIEGAETRMLENRNSSMTTATETLPDSSIISINEVVDDEMMQALKIDSIRKHRKAVELYDMPTDGSDADAVMHASSSTYRQHTDETHEINDDTASTEYDGNSEHTERADTAESMNDAIDQQLIQSIEQYVQQNMSRGPINLEEMATAMGMSMKPFFQKVRDVTGKTPAEVVRDIRLKHACILLQRTNINMSELASNIGFATAEHFMNLFKERFGISPSEYRQRYRR